MMTVDEAVLARRAVRGFLPDRAVPPALLREALELAQRSPSDCNVQPWRVFVASGQTRDRLRAALLEAFDGAVAPHSEVPHETFVGDYRRLQIESAVALYAEMGVRRDDAPARIAALRRNFELFDAPTVAFLCLDRSFGLGVALDLGAYLQTLMLALTARGLASCPQAALRYYPSVVRALLDIPETLTILLGVSIGYEEPSVPANRVRQRREPLAANVTFFE